MTNRRLAADEQGQELPLTGKGLGDWQQLSTSGWSLFDGDICLPVATLNWQVVERNLAWMATFASQQQALLAPHGKTAMTPALFQAQQAAGAWGCTVATVPQLQVAVAASMGRVVLANPLVGRAEQRQVAKLLQQGLEFYCLIDDATQLPGLQQVMAEAGVTLQLLLELGVPGGRCGVRGAEAALDLAKRITAYPALKLCGVEFYEGVVKGGEAALKQFIRDGYATAAQLHQAGLLQTNAAGLYLVSGAGSAYYDLVADEFQKSNISQQGFALVLRPGCYALHDSGIYQQAQQQVLARSPQACLIPGALEDALLVWAYVLSRPEADLVVVGLGKRDAAFDAGLPQPALWFQTGMAKPAPFTAEALKIMDQHLLLRVAATTTLAVGDMLAFRTSHPCLTLDKWRQLAVLDDDFMVRRVLATQF
ncbi:alanine racemase [Rheinheimera texasensis]|uniref:alanine racemase n=1 Tax=Rheinheimera texasensis TaxID=306205 RepID=UPI00068FE79B|nr:alanine racemase [Rheinheimera texasensis]